MVKLVITCQECTERFTVKAKEEPRFCCFCAAEIIIDIDDYEEDESGE